MVGKETFALTRLIFSASASDLAPSVSISFHSRSRETSVYTKR